jgi:hypothetical protein
MKVSICPHGVTRLTFVLKGKCFQKVLMAHSTTVFSYLAKNRQI